MLPGQTYVLLSEVNRSANVNTFPRKTSELPAKFHRIIPKPVRNWSYTNKGETLT